MGLAGRGTMRVGLRAMIKLRGFLGCTCKSFWLPGAELNWIKCGLLTCLGFSGNVLKGCGKHFVLQANYA